MSKRIATTIAAAAILWLGQAGTPDATPVSAEQPARGSETPIAKSPACVKVRSEAVYRGFGYDHVVEIENTCDKPMSCSVVTDIIKDASQVSVAPGSKASVTTLRGSPAREFKADVSCKEAA